MAKCVGIRLRARTQVVAFGGRDVDSTGIRGLWRDHGCFFVIQLHLPYPGRMELGQYSRGLIGAGFQAPYEDISSFGSIAVSRIYFRSCDSGCSAVAQVRHQYPRLRLPARHGGGILVAGHLAGWVGVPSVDRRASASPLVDSRSHFNPSCRSRRHQCQCQPPFLDKPTLSLPVGRIGTLGEPNEQGRRTAQSLQKSCTDDPPPSLVSATASDPSILHLWFMRSLMILTELRLTSRIMFSSKLRLKRVYRLPPCLVA